MTRELTVAAVREVVTRLVMTAATMVVEGTVMVAARGGETCSDVQRRRCGDTRGRRRRRKGGTTTAGGGARTAMLRPRGGRQ